MLNLSEKYISFMIVFLILSGCGGGKKAIIYRAIERPDVDIIRDRAGLIRTLYCDLYIEYVDRENWDYLKKFSFFKGNGSGYPIDPCFHFIIVNTWNRPMIVDKVELLCPGEAVRSEDYSFIKDEKYKKNRYSFDLGALFVKRRILSDGEILRDIDFSEDSIEYRLGFVAPGDRISFFSFFSRVPCGNLKKIRVTIKYHDIKKVIDFDIGRFEYNEIE